MSGKDGDVADRGRKDRLVQERVHDPYMTRSRPAEPTVCPECGVVAQGGRWQWLGRPPDDARQALCPACQRIRDRVPAGILTLSGGFLAEHRGEILNLVHNKADREKQQHPLKRIMRIEDGDDGDLVVTFTDVHLPRGVGQAIASAYEGDLDIHYEDQASLVRVCWRRDA